LHASQRTLQEGALRLIRLAHQGNGLTVVVGKSDSAQFAESRIEGLPAPGAVNGRFGSRTRETGSLSSSANPTAHSSPKAASRACRRQARSTAASPSSAHQAEIVSGFR